MIPVKASIDPPFQASKWQFSRLLIDPQELQQLFDFLGDFSIVQISGVIAVGQEMVRKNEFLDLYQQMIERMKEGKPLSDPRARGFFSSVLTVDLNALYCIKVNEEKVMVKVCKPVIQLQPHRFDYSAADGTFRSMVLGSDCIPWGLQFSYPQLYQDEDLQVHPVREGALFPNTALFKKLQRWVRLETVATPFEVQGKKINVPIRLGKQCFSWINSCRQLAAKGLKVSAPAK